MQRNSYGHALAGVRVDGPLGRRFLRGLSLTRLWREGCGGAYEFIEGASLYKTFTTALRALEMHPPLPAAPPKGGSVASQSPECFSCYMTQKANPVTFLRPL